jgi:uncharacterized protein
MTGTYVNVAAIIIGSLLGVMLHGRVPDRFRLIIFQGIGLSVLALGITMGLRSENFVLVILSLVVGGIIGESFRLNRRFEQMGGYLKKKMRSDSATFIDGFVTASLLFCVGAMAVLGSIEDGLHGDSTILLAKSIMDGVTSLALASALGIGVLFSAIPILLYQGGIAMAASQAQDFFTESMLNELSSVGGVLLIGLALHLLDIKAIRTVNLLPALAIVVALVYYLP